MSWTAQQALVALAALVGAYLVGSIPWAYVIVRAVTGEDITAHGTGNVGAMNVRRTTGSWGWFAVAMLAAAGQAMGSTAAVIFPSAFSSYGEGIQDKDGQGNIRSEHQLPFDVALDKFELQTYPGTMRPSGFLSHVEITDHDTGRTFPADIWMNHELHHRGFALFQSSYQQDAGRQATVLAISKDPGQNLVFAGYITLLIGMIIVLSTRIAQARESAARAVPAKPAAKAAARRGPGRKALLVLLLLSVAGLARAGTVAARAAIGRLAASMLDTAITSSIRNIISVLETTSTLAGCTRIAVQARP